ncbi:hypothetical protein A1O3_03085 [Capronia epimyces CBS 606.96]|uniref:BTB domain-containing protein n=1 Tax=Capronia epimyces CBS 606.96 TaxID=1182542 RepID=W9YAY9_9EURO|nr:uncharacterized protein A1O3_03085 [Capronia epimyces CBS 606.96]EXJ90017.1 hypothetical protein A1O3_03085 [Capronia epimyces CBS 606.96]
MVTSTTSQDASSKSQIFAFSDIISVFVGQNKLEYRLHEAILTTKSPFFEKCLCSGMKEQQEKKVYLPDVNPSEFDIMIMWMYTEKVNPGRDNALITGVYLLADRFCMPDLQNGLVDAFRANYNTYLINPMTVKNIWRLTPEGCKLREAALDLMFNRLCQNPSQYRTASVGKSATTPQKPESEFAIEFAIEFEKLLQENGPLPSALFWKRHDHNPPTAYSLPPDPSSMSGCVYHVHANGKKCK